MSDWGDIVGPLVTAAAPTIGSVIGGLIPIPGASAIGGALGQLIADQFGVPATPDAVKNAIQNSPSDVATSKLQAAEAEAIAKWPALAEMAKALYEGNSKQASAINQTMRAELASGQVWWSWRNIYGYSVGLEASLTSFAVLYGLIFAPVIFKNISESFNFFITWYGMRFGLLGYIHNGASNEKIAAVTGEAPGMVKSIVKAITGKK